MAYPRIASLKTIDEFQDRLRELEIELACDPAIQAGDAAIMAQPIEAGRLRVGNRFCILPMEGWDGTHDGKPTELTRRRWHQFAISGAKLIWGGEAVAVRHDGRANPNQLLISEQNLSEIESLRTELVRVHQERFGASDGLVVGLQLTHSGRFARPNEKSKPEPRTVQRNPGLDHRFSISDDAAIMTDDELSRLVDDFIVAATHAEQAGFGLCRCQNTVTGISGMNYSAVTIESANTEAVSKTARDFCVMLSPEYDRRQTGSNWASASASLIFFRTTPARIGVGIPEPDADPRLAFGGDGSGHGIDLDEPSKLMSLLQQLDIKLVCTTAGSPYYNPHIQRPAYFPPSDGYQPPEDPLVGVARQIDATAELKRRHPELVFVGSGYTYLQEWLPERRAGGRASRQESIRLASGGWSFRIPNFPRTFFPGRTLVRKKICRTFSDCTTAPRNGMVSGCYPLDAYYKAMPERKLLAELKKALTPEPILPSSHE